MKIVLFSIPSFYTLYHLLNFYDTSVPAVLCNDTIETMTGWSTELLLVGRSTFRAFLGVDVT